MSDNARVTLLFFANVFLYFIIGEANNLLSGISVYLHLDALLIAFFGLYMRRKIGILFTVLLGLMADAVHPSPMGTYLVGYLAIWLFFGWCQRRIRRQNPVHIRFVAVFAQICWILLLSAFLGSSMITGWIYWQRILSDLLISAAAVAVLVWPWCLFQKNLLHRMGWDLEAQPSQM